MTQLEMAHAAAPESRTVCGVECSRVWGTSYVGRLAQLAIAAHVDGRSVSVSLHSGEECLAVGHGSTLESAERAMESDLRHRTTMLADASLTMAARGAL